MNGLTPLDQLIAEFTAWSDARLDEEEKANRITQPLYHYTDAAGLKGILESKTIWFTDYRYMNDPSEFFHGIDQTIDTARLMAPLATKNLSSAIARYSRA